MAKDNGKIGYVKVAPATSLKHDGAAPKGFNPYTSGAMQALFTACSGESAANVTALCAKLNVGAGRVIRFVTSAGVRERGKFGVRWSYETWLDANGNQFVRVFNVQRMTAKDCTTYAWAHITRDGEREVPTKALEQYQKGAEAPRSVASLVAEHETATAKAKRASKRTAKAEAVTVTETTEVTA